jgi:hypothetical protein
MFLFCSLFILRGLASGTAGFFPRAGGVFKHACDVLICGFVGAAGLSASDLCPVHAKLRIIAISTQGSTSIIRMILSSITSDQQ